MLNKKTVLITGGTGSFGKRCLKFILSNYKNVKKIIYIKYRVLKHRIGAFPEVLEGLGQSGKLVELTSSYPGASPAPW